MNRQPTGARESKKAVSKPKSKSDDDERIDISSGEDINVDEGNAVGSPKNSLTAAEATGPEDPE